MRLTYLADPTSTHTVKWLAYFLQRGDEVHLLGWNHPTDKALAGVHYHHLPDALTPPFVAPVRSVLWRLGWWPLAFFRQMQHLLNQIQPDIFDILMINAADIPAALARRGPLVLTPWGSDLLEYPRGYTATVRWLLCAALRRADLVLCNSEALAQAAVHFGTPVDRVRRVGQVVDLSCFRPGLDRQQALAQAGIAGSPVLLSPRLILPLYQIETAIEALARVRQSFPSAILVQLGDRSLDPDYACRLENLIVHLGLEDAVIFPGRQSYEQMPYLFAASDVVLSLPTFDSRPSTVYEAMACGVPVVAGDLPSLREIVSDGETGLLVPLDDAGAIGAAVVRLVSDVRLRQRIIENGLTFVRTEGEYEAQMAVVAGYYEMLLAQRREGLH
ncbi:MAG: glycosyltransferase family 4 protein [Caldilinea sp.]